jgi:hypothetical protein
MKRVSIKTKSNRSIDLLSRLLLAPRESASKVAKLETDLVELDKSDFDSLVTLACANHVIIRAIGILRDIASGAGDAVRTAWADEAIAVERSRIDHAIPFLDSICRQFAHQCKPIAVIKSLDHWPDLGSDLDLYTDATPAEVIQLMKQAFDAKLADRSWGDRLAGKWNFVVPGLPELVEIHVGRLGQTGEQAAFSSALMRRTRGVEINDLMFRVPAISDRVVISVLQRMYRHFYFRLCDIVDSASLVDDGRIDYADLRAVATAAGVWKGVATYLVIVSDYVQRFRGTPLDLPEWVLIAARFDARDMYFARDFLRIPILPHSARLYGSQIVGALRKRQINYGARLSLLPWLATAALVGQKMTGSDKGIW